MHTSVKSVQVEHELEIHQISLHNVNITSKVTSKPYYETTAESQALVISFTERG